MRVQNINGTNFQSRNKTIRFADDIARRVNQCYPRISSTKVESYNNISKFPNLEFNMQYKISEKVRKLKSELFDEDYSFLENIKAFITPVKKFKTGNCGESSQLAAIIAKINGIKDCHLVQLINETGKEFDHVVLYVHDKNPYIIDSWLGFADYLPNAVQKYKNEYDYIFNIDKNEIIVFSSETDDAYSNFLKDDFSRKQINKLKRIYPEHVIKRGYI